MNRDESRRSKRSRIDRDFDMGSRNDIITGDFDDERTLDEEEALEGSEDTHNELSNLQKEGDMPLNELLHMYGYTDLANDENDNGEDEDDEGEEDDEDEEEDEDDEEPGPYEPDLKQFYTEMVKNEENKAKGLLKTTDNVKNFDSGVKTNSNSIFNCSKNTLSKNGDETKLVDGVCSEANENVNNIIENNLCSENPNSSGSGGGSSRLLRSVSRPQSEEEEDDCDYSPDEEEWKKTIMVGSDYQAAIPEGLCKYDDALPYENEDKMLWDPSPVTEAQIVEFLLKAKEPTKTSSLPVGSHLRDDEQALYLLLQCGYNLEEALRRRKINALPSTESVSLWSEDECHNFESGLRNYGKDFHLIQKNKVRTRSVGELVQFYYLWKKTERHDIFTYKARLEKKKYALHPGITDYMDRFLEEQEGVRDRSSSPNVHCLLYGDAKRQRMQANSTNNEDAKPLDNWDETLAGSASGPTMVNNAVMDSHAIDVNSSTTTLPSITPSISVIPIQTHNNSDGTINSSSLSKRSTAENHSTPWALSHASRSSSSPSPTQQQNNTTSQNPANETNFSTNEGSTQPTENHLPPLPP